MSKTGPILLIDDDPDDHEIFRSALTDVGVPNEFVWFPKTTDAFHFLKTMGGQPFLIFCDVNLAIESGLDFKKKIDADPALHKKSIPFLFYSTSVDKRTVTEAYVELTIQGFFQKEFTYQGVKNRLKMIVDYWMQCEHPA
ncbi:MAG: response regulator receiver protein [Bacteroidetes bacterium]|jgi:CheY-like chemotaxis protein|nr:response regulator receiver protein [Bacteroidota bacterium]